MSDQKKQKQDQQGLAASQKPNIRLTADEKVAPVAVEADVHIGMLPAIRLPDEATQRQGWHEERAHLLLALYPGVYKRPTDK